MDIHKKSISQNIIDRLEAIQLLESHFPNISDKDKDQAWQDLHMLTQDQNSDIQWEAARVLGRAFSHVPEEHKDQAWQDLHMLTQDQDIFVQWEAARALGRAFSHIPKEHKDQAWQDLHMLTQEHDSYVRLGAADALGSAFGYVPDKDKDQAWQDLHSLTQDQDGVVRDRATDAMGSAFGHILGKDKDQAWQDLIKLTQDRDISVRIGATDAIGSAFGYVPGKDKDQAWQDLIRLTQDRDFNVRRGAADAMGSAFGHVPGKDEDQAWQDLIRLTNDQDKWMRMHAYHSLGRASVFKATEAHDKDILKNELEAAVAFFEKSCKESQGGPAEFCYPFYRSYLAITFQKAKEEEVQRYITKARKAVGSSESKNELLKAVQNLAEALKESQRLKGRSVNDIAGELDACMWYCNEAAKYMAAAEDKAPRAVKLMRICNPLLKDRIQATIEEIKKKARLISPEIDQEASHLSLDDPIKAYQCCMRMVSALRDSCKRLPEEKGKLIFGILIGIEMERDLYIILEKIELSMAYTLPAIEAERKEILDRLKNIQLSISKLNVSSGSARKDLYELKISIRSVQDKIAAQELNMDDLSKVIKERDYAMIKRLEEMRDDWLKSVEKMAQDLPSCEDTDGILKEVQGLKQSKRRDVLGITGDISSIAGLFISLIGLAVTLKPG